MAIVTMKELLEAGVHFGHQTRRWDPHMKSYIFTVRNGIHIIDLQRTIAQLKIAYNAIKAMAKQNGIIMFVGTKKQAQSAITENANRCSMPYGHPMAGRNDYKFCHHPEQYKQAQPY